MGVKMFVRLFFRGFVMLVPMVRVMNATVGVRGSFMGM
jgi:hypothetical protein